MKPMSAFGVTMLRVSNCVDSIARTSCTRDAKLEIRVAQFRRAADCAFVQWLGFVARLASKTLAPRRDFTAMPCFVNDFRTEKDQIIAQGRHQGHTIGIRVHKKSK